MMIHKSEPLRKDPWYWVTYGECSSERIDISWMMSSTSSSAFSTSMIFMATACPVRRSTLAMLSAKASLGVGDRHAPCRPSQSCLLRYNSAVSIESPDLPFRRCHGWLSLPLALQPLRDVLLLSQTSALRSNLVRSYGPNRPDAVRVGRLKLKFGSIKEIRGRVFVIHKKSAGLRSHALGFESLFLLIFGGERRLWV